MHPKIEQLLAHRDGEADPAVAAHIAGCAGCRQKLEQMQAVREALCELPVAGPARDVWPEIESSIGRRNAARRHRRLAVAAVLALAIAGIGMVNRHAFRPSNEEPGTQAAASEARAAIDEVVSASRELERLLERPALRSRVMGPRQAAMIVALEDRIAGIDAVISSSRAPVTDDQALALWLERVRLLDALIQTRGAPASTPGIQSAVFHEGSVQ
jgi:hypothetical protein